MTPRSFRYEERGAVATVTLDRPQSLNALTFDVYRELTDTFRALADRPGVRAVVLTVQDGSPVAPVMSASQVMDTHGRGLLLVDRISHDWGVVEEADGAASVWASFLTPPVTLLSAVASTSRPR